MNITSQEITWSAFKFSRPEVEGFTRENDIFYIHLSGNQKIELGYDQHSWPFTFGAPINPPPLPHLIFDTYRFLPEHVLGYYDDPAKLTIRVWTALGEFTIFRSLPQTFSVMQIHQGFRNSIASEWMAAYNLHRTNPFSV